MEKLTLTTKIVLRSDTAENWRLSNPVLLAGEPGTETDTGRLKLGDGKTPWSTLPYAQSAAAALGSGVPENGAASTLGALWLDVSGGGVYLNCTDGPAQWKRLVLAPELAALGAGDMLQSKFASGEKAAQGYVDRAVLADRLIQPLTTAAVAEEGALYFTQPRAQAVAQTVFEDTFPSMHVADLADGFAVLTAVESFVLNGGEA